MVHFICAQFKQKRVSALLLLLYLVINFSLQLTAGELKGTIVLEVTNIRAGAGSLRAALHTLPEAFPTEPQRAFRRLEKRVTGKKMTLIFSNVPYGRYAIALFHDENDNKKLDANFLGIPREGVAASRDAKGFMGPPKFKDASFRLNSAKLKLTTTMSY